ncbi:hypothetical protein BIY26_04710 [Brenneria goodwinii]|uniref:Outer membrane protein n=1 Tax=Brenneria goodwinii TaxID=1109412 RepID=A0A0G4K0M8_9GAMM|nr:DUF1161 domain-containing protein [Brenneria goodwinii]ATA23986.1 hypothetical protein AWC36_07625 [Brenneria goodwinii]MCG8156605.1 DUF1161 domain-containing protein [Brenneria goodwinii]MCG8159673.1 DUF1161 domain-containing protein [Brenneria goodwinii]MCG8165763.1 DUF1161 domain-containing protein [Brenneria goodwinii]MCG8170276.1 DUF1161 domain-containing protein [Brenneria goodwinii]
MKKTIIFGAALFVLAPLAAQASCESVKADISQKIINNGVPESGFTLDIVPNDQVSQVGGQVVGHCENDSQKIVYTRHADGEASTDSAPSTTDDQPAPTAQ